MRTEAKALIERTIVAHNYELLCRVCDIDPEAFMADSERIEELETLIDDIAEEFGI